MTSRTLVLSLLLLPAVPAAAVSPCTGGVGSPSPGRVPLTEMALEGARAFPNPWRSDRNNGQAIRFEAPVNLEYVQVFTASGRWLRTIHCYCIRFTDWDLLNDAGQPVKSGYYVYLMRDVYGRHARGTLAVLR